MTQKVTDAELQAAIDAVAFHGGQMHAAIKLDMPRTALQGRLRNAKRAASKLRP